MGPRGLKRVQRALNGVGYDISPEKIAEGTDERYVTLTRSEGSAHTSDIPLNRLNDAGLIENGYYRAEDLNTRLPLFTIVTVSEGGNSILLEDLNTRSSATGSGHFQRYA